MPKKNDSCYFVSAGHRYARMEDALGDASRRSYETQKHTSVHIYAPSREAASRFGGEDLAHQFDVGGPSEPIAVVNVMARLSLWR